MLLLNDRMDLQAVDMGYLTWFLEVEQHGVMKIRVNEKGETCVLVLTPAFISARARYFGGDRAKTAQELQSSGFIWPLEPHELQVLSQIWVFGAAERCKRIGNVVYWIEALYEIFVEYGGDERAASAA